MAAIHETNFGNFQLNKHVAMFGSININKICRTDNNSILDVLVSCSLRLGMSLLVSWRMQLSNLGFRQLLWTGGLLA